MSISPVSTEKPKIHPQKMLMMLYLVSTVMIFAGMTSAVLVRRAEGNWHYFELPSIFFLSTFLILLSSLTMHWAWIAAKKEKFSQLNLALFITLLLGFGFAVSQFMGWSDLVAIKVFLVGNPSGSFVYVLTGLHLLHLVAALIFLMVTLYRAVTYRIHSGNLLGLELCMIFWHFLDLLWVYLFVFLQSNQ